MVQFWQATSQQREGWAAVHGSQPTPEASLSDDLPEHAIRMGSLFSHVRCAQELAPDGVQRHLTGRLLYAAQQVGGSCWYETVKGLAYGATSTVIVTSVKKKPTKPKKTEGPPVMQQAWSRLDPMDQLSVRDLARILGPWLVDFWIPVSKMPQRVAIALAAFELPLYPDAPLYQKSLGREKALISKHQMREGRLDERRKLLLAAEAEAQRRHPARSLTKEGQELNRLAAGFAFLYLEKCCEMRFWTEKLPPEFLRICRDKLGQSADQAPTEE